MKKITSLLMMLCVGVFVVGCGEQAADDTSSGGASAPDATPEDLEMMKRMMGNIQVSPEMMEKLISTTPDKENVPSK